MTKAAQTIGPDATVEQASQKMRDYNLGLLPVVEEDKLLGAVTERDVVVHAVAEGRHPHLTTVREIMREKPSVCYEDQSITDASLAPGDGSSLAGIQRGRHSSTPHDSFNKSNEATHRRAAPHEADCKGALLPGLQHVNRDLFAL